MNHFIPTQRRGSCPSEVLTPKLVVPPVEFSDLLGGPGSCGESPEPSARPKRSFFQAALATEVEFGCASTALCLRGQLKSCLDAGGEGAEVAYSSDFVIGELDAKVVFKPSEKFKGLQAVDSQFLEEIVIRLKVGARNLEVRRGEIQNFIGCLVEGFHTRGMNHLYFTGKSRPCLATAGTDARRYLRRTCAIPA